MKATFFLLILLASALADNGFDVITLNIFITELSEDPPEYSPWRFIFEGAGLVKGAVYDICELFSSYLRLTVQSYLLGLVSCVQFPRFSAATAETSIKVYYDTRVLNMTAWNSSCVRRFATKFQDLLNNKTIEELFFTVKSTEGITKLWGYKLRVTFIPQFAERDLTDRFGYPYHITSFQTRNDFIKRWFAGTGVEGPLAVTFLTFEKQESEYHAQFELFFAADQDGTATSQVKFKTRLENLQNGQGPNIRAGIPAGAYVNWIDTWEELEKNTKFDANRAQTRPSSPLETILSNARPSDHGRTNSSNSPRRNSDLGITSSSTTNPDATSDRGQNHLTEIPEKAVVVFSIPSGDEDNISVTQTPPASTPSMGTQSVSEDANFSADQEETNTSMFFEESGILGNTFAVRTKSYPTTDETQNQQINSTEKQDDVSFIVPEDIGDGGEKLPAFPNLSVTQMPPPSTLPMSNIMAGENIDLSVDPGQTNALSFLWENATLWNKLTVVTKSYTTTGQEQNQQINNTENHDDASFVLPGDIADGKDKPSALINSAVTRPPNSLSPHGDASSSHLIDDFGESNSSNVPGGHGDFGNTSTVTSNTTSSQEQNQSTENSEKNVVNASISFGDNGDYSWDISPPTTNTIVTLQPTPNENTSSNPLPSGHENPTSTNSLEWNDNLGYSSVITANPGAPDDKEENRLIGNHATNDAAVTIPPGEIGPEWNKSPTTTSPTVTKIPSQHGMTSSDLLPSVHGSINSKNSAGRNNDLKNTSNTITNPVSIDGQRQNPLIKNLEKDDMASSTISGDIGDESDKPPSTMPDSINLTLTRRETPPTPLVTQQPTTLSPPEAEFGSPLPTEQEKTSSSSFPRWNANLSSASTITTNPTTTNGQEKNRQTEISESDVIVASIPPGDKGDEGDIPPYTANNEFDVINFKISLNEQVHVSSKFSPWQRVFAAARFGKGKVEDICDLFPEFMRDTAPSYVNGLVSCVQYPQCSKARPGTAVYISYDIRALNVNNLLNPCVQRFATGLQGLLNAHIPNDLSFIVRPLERIQLWGYKLRVRFTPNVSTQKLKKRFKRPFLLTSYQIRKHFINRWLLNRRIPNPWSVTFVTYHKKARHHYAQFEVLFRADYQDKGDAQEKFKATLINLKNSKGPKVKSGVSAEAYVNWIGDWEELVKSSKFDGTVAPISRTCMENQKFKIRKL